MLPKSIGDQEAFLTVEDKMPPQMEHLPREDFEDARPPRPRKKVLSKKRREVEAPNLKRLKHKTQHRHNSNIVEASMNHIRPRRQAALRRIVRECDSEVSDEFNSNSENEGDLTNRNKFRRPQRECKARTKTLVAISLAEQDYEKFDLDFAKFKTDVTSHMASPVGLEVRQLADFSVTLEAALVKAAAALSPPTSPADRVKQETGRPQATKKMAKKVNNNNNKVKKGKQILNSKHCINISTVI